MPLARHAKLHNMSAVYIGGFLPMLFGVHGRRHRIAEGGKRFAGSFNEHWISAVPEETPPNKERMEGGAYW
jgi:hypothetical protein|eukprot:4631288-Prymnesium_polylepis.2